jgi:hypothetical protein
VRLVDGVLPGQLRIGEDAEGLRVVSGRGQLAEQDGGGMRREHARLIGVQAESLRVLVQFVGQVPGRV